jgi:putative NIF3 family GTP cyclohydrolase 1 type 2
MKTMKLLTGFALATLLFTSCHVDVIDEDFGLGVVGIIKRKRADDLIADIKLEFGLETLRYIGNLTDTIEKVAIIGGSGSSHIYQAIDNDVDLFITGDVTYHRALDAKNLGLNVLDVGHYFESHGIQEVKQVLISKGITLPIKVSNINTNPYKKV